MSACIEWQGYRDRDGYGQRGRNTKVHREAYEKARGPIPKGLRVLHTCDNPPCYNIGHLYLGTQRQNARDARDRARIGRQKLRPEQAEEIRQRYAVGGVRQVDLAAEFGVGQTTISKIVIGQTWKEVSLG